MCALSLPCKVKKLDLNRPLLAANGTAEHFCHIEKEVEDDDDETVG